MKDNRQERMVMRKSITRAKERGGSGGAKKKERKKKIK